MLIDFRFRGNDNYLTFYGFIKINKFPLKKAPVIIALAGAYFPLYHLPHPETIHYSGFTWIYPCTIRVQG